MAWWETLLIAVGAVWLLGTVLLTINHVVRHIKAYHEMPFIEILQSIYDSAWWPVFTIAYGLKGLWTEITGKP
jgi:hypothetical protein